INGVKFISTNARVVITAWKKDKSHYVKLSALRSTNQITLKQKNGRKSRTLSFVPSTPLATNTVYDLILVFDGTKFQLFLNGTSAGTLTALTTPSGNTSVAVTSSNTSRAQASFDSFFVY